MTAENQEIYNTRVVDTSQGIRVKLDEGCPDEFAEVIARTFRTGKPQQGTFDSSGAFNATDHFAKLEERINELKEELAKFKPVNENQKKSHPVIRGIMSLWPKVLKRTR